MNEINIISDTYKHFFGVASIQVTPLPRSGSDRRYFRITSAERSVIGAFNPVKEENEAFTGFTKHFISKGLRVPEIYVYLPDKNIYFLQDLGDTNLYTWLRERGKAVPFDTDTKNLYRKTLDHLILFQREGIDGLDLRLCYPHKSFDRQSMMWDMNYFKYMFLKLLGVPFNESHLERDFNSLADFLLEASQNYFLYRDFQTANIMIVDDEPWFIDYQGGRKGAPQYDVASLLFDVKTPMNQQTRDELLNYFIGSFCNATHEDRDIFIRYYSGFSMIRVMQALGAFGFRGLYEQKPTFTESIVPGVEILLQIIRSAGDKINLTELYHTIELISDSKLFRELQGETI